MHFESVAEKHVLSLLEFERSNKAYFELSIAPREAAFYSLDGVGYHISELLYLQQQERAWGYLLVDEQRNEEAKSMGIKLLTSEVMDNNAASEKVLIKNGFSPKLCFRRKYRHQGAFHNSIYIELAL